MQRAGDFSYTYWLFGRIVSLSFHKTGGRRSAFIFLSQTGRLIVHSMHDGKHDAHCVQVLYRMRTQDESLRRRTAIGGRRNVLGRSRSQRSSWCIFPTAAPDGRRQNAETSACAIERTCTLEGSVVNTTEWQMGSRDEIRGQSSDKLLVVVSTYLVDSVKSLRCSIPFHNARVNSISTFFVLCFW